jgi:integrase
MNRRRSASRRSFPANLYVKPDGYYFYRNPTTGKVKGLGRDKATAFSEARAANAAIASMNKSDLAAWVRGTGSMTFKAWLPVYRGLWIALKKPSSSTITAAERYLDRFAAADWAHLPIEAITTQHCAEYLDSIAENSGPGAALNMRARLSDVFAFAITKGHLEAGRNPVTSTILAPYSPSRDRLSLDQFLAIREQASDWLRNAMNLALLTGQRISDVAAMKFGSVQQAHLYVEPIKMQGAVKLRIDVKVRLEAVGMSIDDAIKMCRDRIVSSFMVHHQRGGGQRKPGDRVTASSIREAFNEARDAAGVKWAEGKTPPTFHEIRSLAERLYRKEYGREFAQALLGHKSENMTMKYDDLRGSGFVTVAAR